MDDFATTLRALLEKATPGPVYVGYDRAEECGPHKDSGLALIDTGRQSDWPIARLCEWNNARLLEFLRNRAEAILALVEAAKYVRGNSATLDAALRALDKGE